MVSLRVTAVSLNVGLQRMASLHVTAVSGFPECGSAENGFFACGIE